MDDIIELKDVKLKNFMSFKEDTLELDNKGLVLIEGFNQTGDNFSSNGSGKSTLLNAITYALYGRIGYTVKADDVINRDVGKDTSVTLNFDKGDTKYRIERYRKHSEHKNKVLLFENEKEITQKSVKDTNDLIIEIIEMDYDTYTNSIMYGQGDSIVFSQATDKQKKEILEDITNISVYNKAQEVAKEKVKEYSSNVNDNEREQEQVKQEISKLQALAEQAKETYNQTSTRILATEKEIQDVKEEIKNKDFESQIENLKQELEESNTDTVSALKEELDDLNAIEETPFNADLTVVQTLEESLNKLSDAKNLINNEIHVVNSNMSRYEQEMAQLDTAEFCPTCGHPLDVQHAKQEQKRLEKELQQGKERVQELEKYIAENVTPLEQSIRENITKEELKIEEARKDHNNQYIEKNQRILHITNEINQLEREESDRVNRINSNIQTLTHEEENLRNRLVFLQEDLSKLESIPKPNLREEEIKAQEDKLDKLKEENTLLFIAKENYGDAVKVFSNKGVRSMVLDLVTPFLNRQANKYLAKLTGSTIEVNFTTQVENQDGSLADRFDVEVNNSSGGSTYLLNSEGEKKRIDLAISFALQDLVSSGAEGMNVALYDEIFESLDQVGAENVIDILQDKVKEVGTIFVITHNEHLKPLFENVLTVTKEGGESKIMREES